MYVCHKSSLRHVKSHKQLQISEGYNRFAIIYNTLKSWKAILYFVYIHIIAAGKKKQKKFTSTAISGGNKKGTKGMD